MKTFILILAAYFAACFALRTIRFIFFPRDALFNTTAQNVGALTEYGLLSIACLAVGTLG